MKTVIFDKALFFSKHIGIYAQPPSELIGINCYLVEDNLTKCFTEIFLELPLPIILSKHLISIGFHDNRKPNFAVALASTKLLFINLVSDRPSDFLVGIEPFYFFAKRKRGYVFFFHSVKAMMFFSKKQKSAFFLVAFLEM